MRGTTPRAYIAIASGSPCVVPSHESSISPSMNKLELFGMCWLRQWQEMDRACEHLEGLSDD